MSKKAMVIVESPAKAKTISKFLGGSYSVVSSMGHIVDLPQRELGVTIEDNFKPELVVIPGKKKLLGELKKAAKEMDDIYFATDPDREGEAIGWNLKEWMKLKAQKTYRVEFHEITKTAIEAAFRSPRGFNEDRIRAQQARRILDRIVGYFLSPLLWRKVTRGLSAGRVQSVALRLIVDRERQIQAFTPEEYWSLEAELKKVKDEKKIFTAFLERIDDVKVELVTEAATRQVMAGLDGQKFSVASVEKTSKARHPLAPFITSTLQQDSFNKPCSSRRRCMKASRSEAKVRQVSLPTCAPIRPRSRPPRSRRCVLISKRNTALLIVLRNRGFTSRKNQPRRPMRRSVRRRWRGLRLRSRSF
jgi:DNA topoisomerase-1